MKRITVNTLTIVAVAALLVGMVGIATAGMTSSLSKDASKLNAEITMLNTDVNLPQGEKVISKELTDTFRVDSSKFSSLIGRNMQYGDIAAILAFAEKMPGGVTDDNINRVVIMRSSATGWDQVARRLNVSIGDVAARLSSLEDSAHRNIKQAYADSLSAGAGAGGGVIEQPGEDMSGGSAGGADSDAYGEGTGGTDSRSSDEMNSGSSPVPGGSGY